MSGRPGIGARLRLADYAVYHLLKQQGVVTVGALQAACHQRERGRSEQAAPTVLVEDASGGAVAR